MEWGWIIIYGLAIVGAALIVGGVVAFRGSGTSNGKALSAAGIAAGVVMWAIVLLVVPVSVEQVSDAASEAPAPQIVTESVER